MTDNPNVLLLTTDALRADHLGYHGYERNIESGNILDETTYETDERLRALDINDQRD